MQLAIVLSKAGAGEARIVTNTDLNDVVHFLTLLGVNSWNLYDKGTARLEANGPDLYVAIGPPNAKDSNVFLKQASSTLAI